MITVKMNCYSKEELDLLTTMFEEMDKTMDTKCENNVPCSDCKYKTLCSQIYSTTGYLKLEREKGYPKSR